MYDIALRRTSDKVKRVACHECERRDEACPQDIYFAWADDIEFIDGIGIGSLRSVQFDPVTNANVLESAKEAVSMAGDADVPRFTWPRRSGNPSHRVVQRQTVCSIKKWNLKPDLRNVEHGQRSTGLFQDAFFVGRNSILIPQAEINSG